MSGSNPFRRSKQITSGFQVDAASQDPPRDATTNEDDEIVQAEHRFPSLDTGNSDKGSELARQSPKPKGKTVRIVSPHSTTSSSDEDGSDQVSRSYATSSSGHKLFSPPPSATSSSLPQAFEDSPKVDPFSAGSDGEDMSEEEDGASSEDEMEDPAALKVQSPLSPTTTTFPKTTPLVAEIEGRRMDANLERVPHGLEAVEGSGQFIPPRPQITSGMPMNPFQRAPGTGVQNVPPSTKIESPVRGVATSKSFPIFSNKAPLDVDAFTRLLLTGDKGSGAATPTTAIFAASHGDSSSNTDASSLSRQSILDSQTDLRLETPRTSIEVSPREEEQQYQFSSRPSKSDRQGPPTPRSRSVKNAGNFPQTVAFGDPSVSRDPIPTIQTTDVTRRSTAPSPGSSSDLNKPLPLPPSSLELEKFEAYLPTPVSATSSSESLPTPSSRAKTGPPLPLSRRHSQLRSKHAAPPQSGRSNSIAEEPMPADSKTSHRPLSLGPIKPAAPPPPPRRRGGGSNNSIDISQVSRSAVSSETASVSDFAIAESPSTPSAPSILSPPSQSVSMSMPPPPSPTHSQSSSSIHKNPPPMPPARHSSKRQVRGSPRNSTSGMGTGSGLGSSGLPPPPPPPPRRASSGGSSLSGQSQRRFSAESERMEEEPVDRGGGGGDDILEEMERLRKEIDEARGRYIVREEDI